VDLISANSTHLWNADGTEISTLLGIKPLEALNQEAIPIDSLTLEQYHRICHWDLSRYRTFDCPASTTVNLNAIIACASGDYLEDLVKIALLSDTEVYLDNWITAAGTTGEVVERGWTRYYDVILSAW
jgi:hypothetical protein